MKQPSLRHRRALRTFIVAVIMILANATAAWAQSAFSGGDGTSSNPYQIASVADLQQLATDVNSGTTYSGKYFKVINGIVFNKQDDWNDANSEENNFTPIGNNSHTFQGHFDGGGNTIRGIRIYSNDNNKALFGFISNGATVTGVTLDDARITGHSYCSGIVANSSNSGSVSACIVTDRVAIHAKTDYSHYHGGIVGYNAGNFSVTDCTSSATLTIAEDVVGCKSYGGIVGGTNYNSSNYTTTMSGNIAIGATVPKAADNYYGAICGYVKLNHSTLTDNYYASCTVADKENATNVGIYDASVKDVDGACRIYKLTLADGITADGTIFATYRNDNYYLQGTTITLSGTDEGEGFVYTYILNGTDMDGARFEMPALDSIIAVGEKIADWMYFYEGTCDDPYQIKTTAQLNLLAVRVNNGTSNYENKYFKLMNDIAYTHTTDWDDATSMENNYTAIGKTDRDFKGHFLGDGHTISGIRIYKKDDNWQGLFGTIYSGAEISGITLTDARITGKWCVGGIVGSNYISFVNDCHATATVAIHAEADDALCHGGIVGFNGASTVSHCTSAATLTIKSGASNCSYYGGIAGFVGDATISHNLANGASVPAVWFSGAISGEPPETSCYNYYINCTVGTATTGIGCGDIDDHLDITDNDGAVPAIALYDNGTANTTTIFNYNEQTQNVALYGRTLYKDGNWNTLCLPFPIANIEAEGCPLKGATVRELDKAYITGTTLTLNFKDATTTIEAGKPYIVKWESTEETEDTELKNPVFSGVTVSDATNDYDTQTASPTVTTDERVRFIGTYEQKTIAGEDKSILFLGAGNTLYYPSGQNGGVTIGACRAYFKIGDDAAQARQLTDFNLNFSEATGITTTKVQLDGPEGKVNYTNFTNSDNSWYSLDGRKLATKPTAKGLYIHNGVKIVIRSALPLGSSKK